MGPPVDRAAQCNPEARPPSGSSSSSSNSSSSGTSGPAMSKYQQYHTVRPLWQQLCLGGASAGISVIVTNPMDVIKCRLQLQMQQVEPSSSGPHYRGMVQGVQLMLRSEGW
eukprot:RCo011687